MTSRALPTAAVLIAVAAVAGACTSPPRMWEKQMARAVTERPPEIPTETYEKLALDAAMAEVHAQLCGIETGRLERLLPTYLRDRNAAQPDIVMGAFRFHRDRLLAENIRTSFPPGECLRRKEDYEEFVTDVRAGREPFYRGLEVWR